jgi:hypothetical protein
MKIATIVRRTKRAIATETHEVNQLGSVGAPDTLDTSDTILVTKSPVLKSSGITSKALVMRHDWVNKPLPETVEDVLVFIVPDMFCTSDPMSVVRDK